MEIHGDGLSTNASGHYEGRYEVATMPTREGCHAGEQGARSGSFTIDPSVPTMKIGLNTQPELRDYEYVVVRHVPVSTETYEDWGIDLPDFDTIPT